MTKGRNEAWSLGKWGLSLFLLAGLWIFPRAVQSQQLISNFTTGDVSCDPRSRSESVCPSLGEEMPLPDSVLKSGPERLPRCGGGLIDGSAI